MLPFTVSTARKAPNIVGCVAILLSLVAAESCGQGSQRVSVPAGASLSDIFRVNLYAPYTSTILLTNPDVGSNEFVSESEGKHFVFYREYRGTIGSIRRYEEHFEGADGWVDGEWFELYPSGLRVNDAVRAEYLGTIEIRQGEWRLSVSPEDDAWTATLEMVGSTVTKIIHLPYR